MNLYSAYYDGAYPFNDIPGVKHIFQVRSPEQMEEEGVLVLWGGEDISPSLYNQPVSTYTYAGSTPGKRDSIEWALAKKAIELGIPIIGVCRGAQMLCALAGGTLIQHVEGHAGRHLVKTYDNKTFSVNSIHHQMMEPKGSVHQVRAWVPTPLSPIHMNGLDEDVSVEQEPEYIYFPEVKGYAIQWHPEMLAPNSEANKYILQDISKDF